MQVGKRLFFIIFPFLICAATQAMNTKDTLIPINDYEVHEDEATQSGCCPWQTINRDEEQLLIDEIDDNNSVENHDDNSSSIIRKIMESLCCRYQEKHDQKLDLENGVITAHTLDLDNNNNDHSKSGCHFLTPRQLKLIRGSACEIAFKIGLAGLSNYYNGPRDEITFFAQHHAGEAIARHIKFEGPWRLPKYLLASALIFGAGAGMSFLEFPLFHAYDTGTLPITWFTVFSIINNYFNQLNHDEDHED